MAHLRLIVLGMAVGIYVSTPLCAQTTARIAARGDATRATTRLARTSQPASRPAVKPLAAESMLSRMLKPATPGGRELQPISNSSAIDVTSGTGALAPGAPALRLHREGDFIVDRMGRLNRSRDGKQCEFSFDADGSAMQDPPMILLPNQKLAQMEASANAADPDVRFKVTGKVTQYGGRNYLLIENATIDNNTTE